MNAGSDAERLPTKFVWPLPDGRLAERTSPQIHLAKLVATAYRRLQEQVAEKFYMVRTKEGIIGRGGKTTSAKRDRERALQNIRKEKDAKRALRKAEKGTRPMASDGEDPDLAGLRWGPQEPLY